MSKELKEIVKKIQFAKDWSMEQVASSIDYSRVHLAREIKKKEKSELEDKLIEKHKDVLHVVSNVSRDTVSTGNKSSPAVNKDLSSLIESNLTMSRSIEKNSNSLADLVQMLKEKSVPINSGLHEVADLQREMLAMLKAAIVKDAEYKAAGNQEEGRKILREINKATAEHLGMNKKTDIPVPSKKSR